MVSGPGRAWRRAWSAHRGRPIGAYGLRLRVHVQVAVDSEPAHPRSQRRLGGAAAVRARGLDHVADVVDHVQDPLPRLLSPLAVRRWRCELRRGGADAERRRRRCQTCVRTPRSRASAARVRARGRARGHEVLQRRGERARQRRRRAPPCRRIPARRRCAPERGLRAGEPRSGVRQPGVGGDGARRQDCLPRRPVRRRAVPPDGDRDLAEQVRRPGLRADSRRAQAASSMCVGTRRAVEKKKGAGKRTEPRLGERYGDW